jgi:hypothetical protein
MTTWIDYRTEPVSDSPHNVVVVSNTRIECDYIECSYYEEFDNMEDLLAAKDIHEEQEAY